jgi:hypothetical protein
MGRRGDVGRSWGVPLLVAVLLAVPTALAVAPAKGALAAPERAPGGPMLRAPVAAPHPAFGWPTFQWGTATIVYSPGDDSSHFMGLGAAMVVDDRLRNITTFGGEGAGGLSDYTVNYNYSSGYFQVATILPGPSARTNVSFAEVPGADRAVLFGGLTDLARQTTSSETWVYYFANQSWQNVTHAVAPPPRESAAFAVNVSGNDAILEGGWEPSNSLNGSTGTVIWNDTWSLNLTSYAWTQLHPAHAPPPLYGSGMVWQDATDRFLLFGGCALGCSSGLYSFSGSPADWHILSVGGSPPGARGAAAFAWDEADQVAILVGGFVWTGSGATALGDAYLYAPSLDTWSPLPVTGGPGPRYGAPNAWADFPGCIGLDLLGGNIALAGPPGNDSILEPLDVPSFNCVPDLITGGGGPPPPPCSVAQVPLALTVFDNFSRLGIPNATVQIDGGCVHRSVTTDAQGRVNVSIPAPDTLNLTASAPGYRTNEVVHRFLPNTTNAIEVPLGPFPSLHARTFGIGSDGIPAPLGGVLLEQGTTLLLGRSDANGWFNDSRLIAPTGQLTLVGSRANYSTASVSLTVPYAGPFGANLTLSIAGPVEVHTFDAGTGGPVPFAQGTLSDTDLGSGLSPISFVTDLAGWANLTYLPLGNYSARANATGYLVGTNGTFHPWISPTVLELPLTPQQGAVVDARVIDAATRLPIPGAQVTLLGRAPVPTDGSGWANFSGIQPPGLYEIVATADGYRSNYSWVSLDYGRVLSPYLIPLASLEICPGAAGCPPSAAGASERAFGFLGGPSSLVVLVATPSALLALGLLYSVLLARRSGGRPPRRAARDRRAP